MRCTDGSGGFVLDHWETSPIAPIKIHKKGPTFLSGQFLELLVLWQQTVALCNVSPLQNSPRGISAMWGHLEPQSNLQESSGIICECLLFKKCSSVYTVGVSKSSSLSVHAVCLDVFSDLCVRKLSLLNVTQEENMRLWCPMLSWFPCQGLHEWCFPPRITVAAKRWRRRALAQLYSSEWEFQKFHGNPTDSWGNEEGAGDWRKQGGKQHTPYIKGPLILSQERMEVKVAATPLVNSFRSGRRSTCDIVGTNKMEKSHWTRGPQNWVLVPQLVHSVILDKLFSLFLYTSCKSKKIRYLLKILPTRNVLRISLFFFLLVI